MCFSEAVLARASSWATTSLAFRSYSVVTAVQPVPKSLEAFPFLEVSQHPLFSRSEAVGWS